MSIEQARNAAKQSVYDAGQKIDHNIAAGWRQFTIQSTAGHKQDQGDHHQQCGHSKSERIAAGLAQAGNVAPKNWSNKHRYQTAQIDGQVKYGKEFAQQMRLIRFELIASKRWHARFNATCAQRNQHQTYRGQRTVRIRFRKKFSLQTNDDWI